MADTCIVCLGDLGTDAAVATAPAESTATAIPSLPAAHDDKATAPSPDELIAHLLPCGHNLHDGCLKPWVERANSCPICRAKFNSVELRATLDGAYQSFSGPKKLTNLLGPTISSYAVQDKVQVAEVDPSLIVDDDDLDDLDDHDDHFDNCMVCMITGDESQLLLCDGCNNSCHVCCAGLDSIPAGTWFCYDCLQDPQTIARRNRRRRAARRPRRPHEDSRTTWAYLWRSVANRTNIDLDFPFNDETVTENRAEQRREFNDWQRRFQLVARTAGASAANRFREIARAPETKPEPESQEEIRAWNAFEKARIIDEEDGQTRGRRKRKSRTTSPESAAPPPLERKRKRPRTLVIQDRAQDADLTDSTLGESSRVRSSRARREPAAAPRPRPTRVEPAVAPLTFLQSLLAEVEAKSAQAAPGLEYDVHGEYFPFGLERSTSPDASPLASNHGTPQAMTPPPLRPSSPTLTTNISPIFPPAPEFSQDSVAVQDSVERARSRQRDHVTRQSPGSSPTRPPLAMSEPVVQPSSPPPQAPPQPQSPPPLSLPAASSPTSAAKSPKSSGPGGALNLRAKTEIQALVKAALKPHYRSKRIGAAPYTQINRDVSRRMYELVGAAGMGVADKERWTRVAEEEVAMAVGVLLEQENVDGEKLVVALGLAKDVAQAGADMEDAEATACFQTA